VKAHRPVWKGGHVTNLPSSATENTEYLIKNIFIHPMRKHHKGRIFLGHARCLVSTKPLTWETEGWAMFNDAEQPLTRSLVVNIFFVVDDCVRLHNFHDRSFVGVAARVELACQRLVTLRGHDLRRQHASPCRGGPGARAIFHRSNDVTSVPLHQLRSLPHDNSVSAIYT
jgi:hypothetical protein